MARKPNRAIGGLYGDWDDLRFWANQTRRRATMTKIKKRFRLLGDGIIRTIQNHIKLQDLPWPELSKVTIKRKGHGKVYEETRQYMNSIRRRVTNPQSYTLSLQVYPAGNHRNAGMPMMELAEILEYGRKPEGKKKGIPPRPLWRPVMLEIPELPEYKVFASDVLGIYMPILRGFR